jgi:hypothetical protein
MKTLVQMLRRALFSPLAALTALGAPIPLQLALSRLLVRLDSPLRGYLLER